MVHEFDREKWFMTLQDLLSRYNVSNVERVGFSLTNLVTDSDVFTRQPFINLARIRIPHENGASTRPLGYLCYNIKTISILELLRFQRHGIQSCVTASLKNYLKLKYEP